MYTLFLVINLFGFVNAQRDSIKTDSTKLYKNIETLAERNRFNDFALKLIFRPTAVKPQITVDIIDPTQISYKDFEGKVIRKIIIKTLDPFSYSIKDTIKREGNFVTESLNNIHIQTRKSIIKDLLLFEENQLFDSLLVMESERLVRSRDYVRDVSINILPASHPDSVDLVIREVDKWSIIPLIAGSPSSLKFNLMDKNFIGIGHEFQNGITWLGNSSNYRYNFKYSVPNFRNTYIRSDLNYVNDEFGNYIRSVLVDRPFFSPYAKWAAGIMIAQKYQQDSVPVTNTINLQRSYKYNIQDVWTGYSIRLFDKKPRILNSTNFISAIRFFRIRYIEEPDELVDKDNNFTDEDFFLTSIGISTREYIKDKYIFKYGLTEDVPVGNIYKLTAGFQKKNNNDRLYVGGKISRGNFYRWGYVSYNIEYGTFFKSSVAEQGTLSLSGNYFTGLKEVGRWKYRQFVKTQFTYGLNRYPGDSLTLNDGFGIDGFNSNTLSGKSRMIITLQTQSYAPWNFIGFRFGPYLTYSVGMLADEATGFKNSRMYSKLGLGVLIKNENLVFQTFQVSIAIYPIIPGVGENVIKTNSFKTSDFGFRDFEIGQPAPVLYQ